MCGYASYVCLGFDQNEKDDNFLFGLFFIDDGCFSIDSFLISVFFKN